MREFFDTSVLIAAFWGGHAGHEASLKLLSAANRNHSACSTHTLEEVYAVMTALPVKPMIPPEQGFLFAEEIQKRLSLISLTDAEYFESVRKAADKGLTGGRIYDALLLRCATKCDARSIYTWNLKHFRAIAPELADRLRMP
jgi:predicted nucleic acid-binding protein